ncbi:MAG: hypothetical protein KDK70_24430 [Myxococcales bacterium]|nr:hypothetical protein [Myxococcales bacterium]
MNELVRSDDRDVGRCNDDVVREATRASLDVGKLDPLAGLVDGFGTETEFELVVLGPQRELEGVRDAQ